MSYLYIYVGKMRKDKIVVKSRVYIEKINMTVKVR